MTNNNKVAEKEIDLKGYLILGNIFAVLGTLFFLLFAYDIEYDRDFGTWLWFLTSQLCFLICMRFYIKYDRLAEELEENK